MGGAADAGNLGSNKDRSNEVYCTIPRHHRYCRVFAPLSALLELLHLP